MSEIAEIRLIGEVNTDMFKTALEGMTKYAAHKEINIILNTEGGDVYEAFGIYDLIRFSTAKVKIVCIGAVMSAGTIILQAADERVSLPNTYFMVHYGEEAVRSPDDVKHSADVTKKMKDMIVARSKVSKRTINNWFIKDTYFDPKAALKAGLIDRISE